MYKSGDLGRWLPDGTIEYLGRNDHQVKIRGFLAREDIPGDKRLVAHFTLHEGVDLDVDTLGQHLKDSLHEYMVPAAFVRLDAWPLTPNGKLDRKALLAPEGSAFARHVYEPPQGPMETTLARIWSELLHVDQIGRHDDFFDLGGHSLLVSSR
jgi:acyl-coenzyme A synthetase/AMP-(fatty) acid ligase